MDTPTTLQTKLTSKQRDWLKIYLKTGNATKAAREVYDCKDDHSAAQIGYENLKKLDISSALEEAGITDQKLLKKLDEGLEAQRVISAVNTKKQATGATTDFIEVPDYTVRHKYLETALKLKKRMSDKLEIAGENNEPIQIKIVKDGNFDETNSNGSTNRELPEATDEIKDDKSKPETVDIKIV